MSLYGNRLLSGLLEPGSRIARLVRKLLRIPLFYKILLANSAIFTIGLVTGTIITAQHIKTSPQTLHIDLIALFVVFGLPVSCVINWLVLKLALRPLDGLQNAVNQVQQGRLDTRVRPSVLSDERFDRLIATFNQMMATLERDSQRLHQLSGEILQAQEEERRRVALELHDQTGQSLTSLLLRLRLLERSQDPEEARQRVQELRHLTAQTLEEIHRLALELRPKILDDLGLEAALSWQVDEFNAAGGPRAALEIDGVSGRLPIALEMVFYRVAQEALTNVARHAHAWNVKIILKRWGDELTLEIQDDGVGFDRMFQSEAGFHRLGLVGMRERLVMVGGELQIDSRLGKGTRLVARAPLKQPVLYEGLDE